MALHNRPDGVTIELFEGDFAPGRIAFTTAPDGRGGSTLVVDAVLDVKRSSWLLRRIIKRSPVGEPAALTAAAYVALRAVALRAEHPNTGEAWRPRAPAAAPAGWLPDPRPLAGDPLAPLRARGVAALVARAPGDRLAGVAAAVTLNAPAPTVEARLRDPTSWLAFPGLAKVRVHPGPNGLSADVEDNLPLVDCEATWTAEPGPALRWVATAGATRGARLGWNLYPGGSTIAVLTLFPRVEATGSIARRFIAAEPLLEEGLSLALAFVDAAGSRERQLTGILEGILDLRTALIRSITEIRVGYRAAPWRRPGGTALVGRNEVMIMGMSLAALESHATHRLVRRMSPGALLHGQQ